MPSASRLLLVSNRLPVTVSFEQDRPTVSRSVGGLATGMRDLHETSRTLWLGWPGVELSADDPRRSALDRQLAASRLLSVHLGPEEVAGFYDGFSNAVLWPLFHSMLDRLPLESAGWDSYVGVNQRYADAVVSQYRDGDSVWIHDYQLMLVPELVRRRIPGARIGFFLHIPFPASSVFRALPRRESLLRGILGADLIGFHTTSYVRNFGESLLRTVGLAVDVDRVAHDGRETRIESFPMGIDVRAIATMAREPETASAAEAVRGPEGCAVLAGIDRLDYTKGIPRRLLAYAHLLRTHPELRERVHFLQVAVPSRGGVTAYQRFRAQIDELTGRINGAFATSRWSPVRYLHRGLDRRDVVAIYRAADVMVVTPIRDGMNLVAKEFVAARENEDGVLVLSEFAGAAAELGDALRVNPYDVEGTADVLYRALTMPREEQRRRMRSLRERVQRYDVERWSRRFLEALDACGRGRVRTTGLSSPAELQAAIARAGRASRLVLILDYDGTLAPFARVPEEAIPEPDVLDLLRRLGRRRKSEVHILSGRDRESLASWFGDLPVALHAEHGLWSRSRRGKEWVRSDFPELPARAAIEALLEDFAARTPGARVERKSSVLAWHWRETDPEFGRHQAGELRLHLTQILSNVNAEVVAGDMVIEVRPQGVHKGRLARELISRRPDALFLAMGDDRTDEDSFAALPEDAITVHVGPNRSCAGLRVLDEGEARAFLKSILAIPTTGRALQTRSPEHASPDL